jgi:hypothetical protein
MAAASSTFIDAAISRSEKLSLNIFRRTQDAIVHLPDIPLVEAWPA